ncbi:MAG: DNA polymerase III subunit alpha, partial [Lachnospiraceae bacterium]|nr:DNA polymerase III subunit alpha [Lachnospiraceae bacterium]
TLEVIVFPKDYEKYGPMLEKDAKLFVQGKVSAEEDKASKLICERIWRFEDVHAQIWIQFPTKEAYLQRAGEIRQIASADTGNDEIIIYVRDPRSIAKLGRACPVKATKEVIGALKDAFGEENVKVR